MERQYVTVIWNKLDPTEKQTVAGLYNIMAFSLQGEPDAEGKRHSLWTEVEIWHPLAGFSVTGESLETEEGYWDAVIEITDAGDLELCGSSGPGGQAPHMSQVLSGDTVLRFCAWVE